MSDDLDAVIQRTTTEITERVEAVVTKELAIRDQMIRDLTAACKRMADENTRLRAQLDAPYSDDLADAARDRERDADFQKSEDYLDRGARG